MGEESREHALVGAEPAARPHQLEAGERPAVDCDGHLEHGPRPGPLGQAADRLGQPRDVVALGARKLLGREAGALELGCDGRRDSPHGTRLELPLLGVDDTGDDDLGPGRRGSRSRDRREGLVQRPAPGESPTRLGDGVERRSRDADLRCAFPPAALTVDRGHVCTQYGRRARRPRGFSSLV